MPDSEPARKGAHTPERWTVEQSLHSPGAFAIWDGESTVIGRVWREHHARLIAEAPAMEEALRTLAAEIDDIMTFTNLTTAATEARNAARAILARLDGEGGE